ncbi:unnamed protein product [Penicillium camemberti]|uniref:Str. FM013 n=1 Tax=Penicillium camemberti (strain FM 013) TaxID=1429867 RepID=A0A0G4PQM8_PENC3|nr:unnamed protein product [Penicillium camemberti]
MTKLRYLCNYPSNPRITFAKQNVSKRNIISCIAKPIASQAKALTTWAAIDDS